MAKRRKPQTTTLPDFLTKEQIRAAIDLYEIIELRHELLGVKRDFIARCVAQIMEPNMAEINRKLGQKNDPTYLAYAVRTVIESSRKE